MRSILLVVGTLLLTAGAFFMYRFLQPIPERVLGGNGPVAQVVPVEGLKAPHLGPAGRGDRPWIRNIDRQGRLTSQFRADEYQPRGGGHVHVIQPRAEFFQYTSGGHVQKVAIDAETGDIEVQQPAEGGSGSFEKGSAGPPKRGNLKRGVDLVTIRLYPDIAAPFPQKDHVSITLTTDNLSFDNETFEVRTAAIIDQNGNEVVPADQVPIHVDGDYQFEGQGLKLNWNDLEGRLEYLEVAHGEHLTILHPSSASSPFGGVPEPRKVAPGGAGGTAAPPTLTASSSPGDAERPLNPGIIPVTPAAVPLAAPMLASDKVQAGGHRLEAVKSGRHGTQPPYLATFERDIHITQGTRGDDEKLMATANQMTLDFLLNQSKPTTHPATQPGSPSNAAPLTGSGQLSSRGSGQATVLNTPSITGAAASTAGPNTAAELVPTTRPSAVPTTQPSTQPSDPTEPVNVYWTGTLVVVPNNNLSSVVLQPGQSIVHLIGSEAPVHVMRDANDVVCARLDYFSPDGNVALFRSPAFPRVVVRQRAIGDAALGPQADPESAPLDDAVITTENLDYSGTDHVAVLRGASEAQVQLKADPADPAGSSLPGLLDVRWQRLARIYFLNHTAPSGVASPGKLPGQMAVDHAHFEGDVEVRHPQLALNSQLLDTTFAAVPAPTAGSGQAPSAGPGQAPASLPSTRPADAPRQITVLRRLVATHAVTCEMMDESGKKQNVECHQMTMDTALSPVGKLYPQTINFDGDAQSDAHAYDPTQDIHAGQIELTFVPGTARPTTAPSAFLSTTRPAPVLIVARASTHPSTHPALPATRPVDLDTMTATDRVRIQTAEGAFASAERLYVRMIEGQPHARLTGKPGAAPGSPESLATVIDAKKNVVIGPTIVSDPKQNIATVDGPGSMHLIRQDSPADKPRPIDVVFLNRAVMDSPDNIIDILGVVSVTSPDPDGTINTATGRHLRITLADKLPEPAPPAGTTRPSTRPAHDTAAAARPSTRPTTRASTRPAGAGAGSALAGGTQADMMKGKVVSGLILEKDALIKSNLADAKGAILRQFELKADLVRYVLASTKPGAKGMIIVPVPGQMLVRDHRPPPAATQPAGKPAAASTGSPQAPAADPGDPGNSRGATAFQWSKQLTYDEATGAAVFTGDVLIVHQDDDSKEEPARLRAEKVVAVFEPRRNPATRPAAPPLPGAAAAPEAPSQMQLKSMTATGNVIVTRGGAQLDAPRMDYDPVTAWMIATGTEREPATYVDPTGVNSATARQIDWNAQSWNVKIKDIISRTGRK